MKQIEKCYQVVKDHWIISNRFDILKKFYYTVSQKGKKNIRYKKKIQRLLRISQKGGIMLIKEYD